MSAARCRLLFSMAPVAALVLLLWLAGPAPSAAASCWNHTVGLCDLVYRYNITYNGGSCGGSYDIDVLFRNRTGIGGTVDCGSGILDFWSISPGGTGTDLPNFPNIIRVFPDDPYCTRQDVFTVYYKVKSYDVSGVPSRTGTGPSPLYVDPTLFQSAGHNLTTYCP